MAKPMADIQTGPNLKHSPQSSGADPLAGAVRSPRFIRQDCESGINASRHDLDLWESKSMAMPDSVELAADVVAAYVSNNPVPKSDLPDLILAVHSSLARLGSEPERALPQAEAKPPAVPIRKSVTPDYLICLEDGKRFKSTRRHLRLHGLTPEQYREKWKLRSDYPMVAPNYAAQRSALATKMGLGQKRRKAR
jgi:predicted transcriptional regulator